MAVTAVDHVIYGAPDLEAAIDEIEHRTGVRPAHGGTHAGRGTRNALLGIGGGKYLELLAPDPEQPAEVRARIGPRVPEGAARLTTWAARCDDLEAAVERARGRGVDLGAVEEMSRARPDGHVLRWRLTRGRPVGDGLVPFLIDWGDSEHPSRTAPDGCSLLEFWAEHPEPERIREYLDAIHLRDVLDVERGPTPRLMLTLATPRGEVTLS